MTREYWVVNTDRQTFEAIDAAVTSVTTVVKQYARIYSESEGSKRLALWGCYHTVIMQRLWDVLACLDLVFISNVFAARLSTAASMEEEAALNEQFVQVRSKIDAVAGEIEPLVARKYEFESSWCSHFIKRRKLKETLPLLRVIDMYLINFKKEVNGTLVPSSLESSMWHKRTRVHEFVGQEVAAEGGALEILLKHTKKESDSFYKGQVAKFAMKLLQDQ